MSRQENLLKAIASGDSAENLVISSAQDKQLQSIAKKMAQGGGITIDSALSEISENPVQNKVILNEIRKLNEKINSKVVDNTLSETSENPVQNKVVNSAIQELNTTCIKLGSVKTSTVFLSDDDCIGNNIYKLRLSGMVPFSVEAKYINSGDTGDCFISNTVYISDTNTTELYIYSSYTNTPNQTGIRITHMEL